MKLYGKRRHEEAPDLNVTPMVDLFVSLIAFLLITAAFVRIGGVKVNMPSAKAAAESTMQKSDKLTVSLTFEVANNAVEVNGFSDAFATEVPQIKKTISLEDSKAGMAQLHAYLTELKTKYESFGSALYHASPTTTYEIAVQVLDTIQSVQGISKDTILAAGVVEP